MVRQHATDSPKTVKQALKHPRIKIVTFDWLEDSLHKKFVRSPVGYSLQDLVRDREATKEKKKTIRKERELKSGKWFLVVRTSH
jgi:hypothetical protein